MTSTTSAETMLRTALLGVVVFDAVVTMALLHVAQHVPGMLPLERRVLRAVAVIAAFSGGATVAGLVLW